MKRSVIFNATFLALLLGFTKIHAQPAGVGQVNIVLNPYKNVNWATFKQHKAALHVHTLQSDGYNMVDEVVRAYQKAGFTILALTDHDKMEPNAQYERGRIDWATFEKGGTPYPKDPKPKNYPFNTTWPWTNFGAPDPKTLGMVGIESAEISRWHHMNNFFSGYGTGYETKNEDEQLTGMQKAGGLAFFNHPGAPAPFAGGGRHTLEWYIERFNKFPSNFLVGIDVSGGDGFSENLWDQLLAHFMPKRPIWGFGVDDMHRLGNLNQSPQTIFALDNLNSPSVRKAMEGGQFYVTQRSNGTAPTVERIVFDEKAGTITIHALNYDKITWISAPKSSELLTDIDKSARPWPQGQVVHQGTTLNYRETPNINKYVRAVLERTTGAQTYRTLLNPIGIGSSGTK